MKCNKCHTDNAIIEQAPDSYFKQVRCLACGYTTFLKNYSKKAKKFWRNN